MLIALEELCLVEVELLTEGSLRLVSLCNLKANSHYHDF